MHGLNYDAAGRKGWNVLSRKRFLQGAGGALLLSMGGSVLVGCGGQTQQQGAAQGDLTKGGILTAAINADPPTLDWTSSTATATRNISWHVFEQLFSFDHEYVIQPMLAESNEVSEDGKTYTLKLRQGVKFHDGSTMKAEDVVASIERWGSISGGGLETFGSIQDVRETDDSTVEIALKNEFVPLLSNLADVKQSLVVLPAKVAKAAGDQPLEDEQLIGTGPYKFESWERGRRLRLSRFDDYAALEKDLGGLAGKKVAYLDELVFNVVKDTQVRLNELQTDQSHYALELSKDTYEQIESLPNVEPVIVTPEAWLAFVPNKARPPFDDVRLRQAVNHALKKEALAQAAYGSKRFYQIDGSIFFPEQKNLYTEEGTEGYDAYDPDRAKQLMQEAGYDGEPIRFGVTSDYPDHFNATQVAVQQLEDVGFKVDLVVLEWPTLLERRENKDALDIFTTSFSPSFDPTVVIWFSPDWAGWYESERMQSLLSEWISTTNPEQQKQLLADMNRTVYEEIPVIKLMNSRGLHGHSTKLLDYENWIDMKLWNTGFSSQSSA